MRLLGSSTIPDNKPVALTLRTADAVAERVRALLGGRRFTLVMTDGDQRFTCPDQTLELVKVETRGLLIEVRDPRYPSPGPMGGMYFDNPVHFTFRPDGLTVDHRPGWRDEYTVTG
jgi:hypothetical protein